MMRGVIESFDGDTDAGKIRSQDENVYPFARTNVLRRSKEPRESAVVVFRLKDGKVFKVVVVSYEHQWELSQWNAALLELFLYLPFAFMR